MGVKFTTQGLRATGEGDKNALANQNVSTVRGKLNRAKDAYRRRVKSSGEEKGAPVVLSEEAAKALLEEAMREDEDDELLGDKEMEMEDYELVETY